MHRRSASWYVRTYICVERQRGSRHYSHNDMTDEEWKSGWLNRKAKEVAHDKCLSTTTNYLYVGEKGPTTTFYVLCMYVFLHELDRDMEHCSSNYYTYQVVLKIDKGYEIVIWSVADLNVTCVKRFSKVKVYSRKFVLMQISLNQTNTSYRVGSKLHT